MHYMCFLILYISFIYISFIFQPSIVDGPCGRDGQIVISHAKEGLKRGLVFVQASKMESDNAKEAKWKEEFVTYSHVHVCFINRK